MMCETELSFRSVTCVVCGSSSFDPVAVGQRFPSHDGDPAYLFVQCRECDLLYLNPRPAGDGDPAEADGSRARLHEIAEELAYGTDAAVAIGDEAVLSTMNGRPRRIILAGGLEEHPSPARILRHYRQNMEDRDELVVLSLNAESGLMRFFGRRHASPYGFPRRLQLFTPQSLRRLAEREGFRIERAFTRCNARAWVESLRNLMLDWQASASWMRRLDRSRLVPLFFSMVEKAYCVTKRGGILVTHLRAVSSSHPVAVSDFDPDRTRRPGPPSRPPAVLDGRPAPVAILGAGVAGLTAARQFQARGIEATVFEAGGRIAGLAQSFKDEHGFSHDFGAHFITNRFAAALGLGSRCRTVHRFGEAVRLDGHTYRYPFGLLRSPRFIGSAAYGRISTLGAPPPDSARELYRRQFGRKLADEVALPLVEAWSGAAAEDLAISVSPPQLDRGIPHVLKLKLASRCSGRAVANGFSRAQPENPHVFHVYPTDGVGVLTERLAEGLEDVIELESRVEVIYVEGDHVTGIRVAGVDREASAVVSTAPVHILPKLVRGTDALEPLSQFRYRPFVLVNMRFDQRPVLPEVCTWIPERHYTFFRLTEAPLAMPWLAPAGKTMVTVDIGCDVGDEIWTMDPQMLGTRCLDELEDLFPGVRRTYLGCHVLRTPVAYPIYLREYELDRIRFARQLPVEGLYSVGRNGEFAHILMEDVFWRTRQRIHDLVDRSRGRARSNPTHSASMREIS